MNHKEIKTLNKTSRIIILTIVFITLTTINKLNPNHTNNYQILKNEKAYARYDDGLIYIISDKEKPNIKLNKGDILVIDSRRKKDPNMIVKSSFEIRNKDKRNTIINVIQEYEKDYPSKWERSNETMRLEWLIHNMSCDCNYKSSHSCSVDFNNGDEKKYNKKILSWLFGI